MLLLLLAALRLDVNDHLHASFATQQSKNRGEQSGPPKSAIRSLKITKSIGADIGDLGRL